MCRLQQGWVAFHTAFEVEAQGRAQGRIAGVAVGGGGGGTRSGGGTRFIDKMKCSNLDIIIIAIKYKSSRLF